MAKLVLLEPGEECARSLYYALLADENISEYRHSLRSVMDFLAFNHYSQRNDLSNTCTTCQFVIIVTFY